MTHSAPAQQPLCRDCDGFPVVAIDTGSLNPDGTRNTLHITCRACQGTGRTSSARVLSGRRA